MRVAVIDSATPAITAAIAVIDDDKSVKVLAERVAVDGRAHGELLAPALHAALAEAGLTSRDLDAVVAGLGPGPFTGLRVGLVTAAAIADATGIPAYGVCTLDAIGLAVADHGKVLVATDARRREVYWGFYDKGARVDGPSVCKPADLVLPDDVVAAAGDGARIYGEVFGLPLVPAALYPPAADLAALAARRVLDRAPSEPLTPLYLRRPDAVEPAARKTVSQPAPPIGPAP
jgi:tRNA threonylcarbamoyl adenosine modification protein YeaZ